jgi:hypothetical protein
MLEMKNVEVFIVGTQGKEWNLGERKREYEVSVVGIQRERNRECEVSVVTRG